MTCENTQGHANVCVCCVDVTVCRAPSLYPTCHCPTAAAHSRTADSSLKVSQVVKGEMSAKTTYQRSAKGPVSISECAADGRFIALENTGRKVSVPQMIASTYSRTPVARSVFRR